MLGSLSRLLKAFRTYPSSQRIIVDTYGQIIAYQNDQALLSKDGLFDTFKSISGINQPALAYAFKHYHDQKGSLLFSVNAEDWLGKVTDTSASNNLLLFQVVKINGLLADA